MISAGAGVAARRLGRFRNRLPGLDHLRRFVVDPGPAERRADLVGKIGDPPLDLKRTLRGVHDATDKVRMAKETHVQPLR